MVRAWNRRVRVRNESQVMNIRNFRPSRVRGVGWEAMVGGAGWGEMRRNARRRRTVKSDSPDCRCRRRRRRRRSRAREPGHRVTSLAGCWARRVCACVYAYAAAAAFASPFPRDASGFSKSIGHLFLFLVVVVVFLLLIRVRPPPFDLERRFGARRDDHCRMKRVTLGGYGGVKTFRVGRV